MKKFLVVSENDLRPTKILKVSGEEVDKLITNGYEVFLKNDEKREETYLLEERRGFEDSRYYIETSTEGMFY